LRILYPGKESRANLTSQRKTPSNESPKRDHFFKKGERKTKERCNVLEEKGNIQTLLEDAPTSVASEKERADDSGPEGGDREKVSYVSPSQDGHSREPPALDGRKKKP